MADLRVAISGVSATTFSMEANVAITNTATPAGTFAKNIQLTLNGLPTGVAPTFSVNPIGPAGTSIISIPTVNIPVGVLSLVLTGIEV